MRLEVSVERADGSTRTVRISPLAIIGWERETGKRLTDLSNSLGMSEIGFLVWEQDRLAHVTEAKSLDEYLADVVDLSPVEQSDPNPQGEEASPELSLNSAQ